MTLDDVNLDDLTVISEAEQAGEGDAAEGESDANIDARSDIEDESIGQADLDQLRAMGLDPATLGLHSPAKTEASSPDVAVALAPLVEGFRTVVEELRGGQRDMARALAAQAAATARQLHELGRVSAAPGEPPEVIPDPAEDVLGHAQWAQGEIKRLRRELADQRMAQYHAQQEQKRQLAEAEGQRYWSQVAVHAADAALKGTAFENDPAMRNLMLSTVPHIVDWSVQQSPESIRTALQTRFRPALDAGKKTAQRGPARAPILGKSRTVAANGGALSQTALKKILSDPEKADGFINWLDRASRR